MAKLLKDLYNESYIKLLTTNIKKYFESFDEVSFSNTIFNDTWESLELKERMRHISVTLRAYLPDNYISALGILKSTSSHLCLDYGLENIIFQDFVEVFGLDEFDSSIDALEHFTKTSSSEFAIRQFILKYPDETMGVMKKWASNENEHVRRLSCEGCRSRLPWAVALPKFKKDPTKVLEILGILQDDKSEYVRKSVANNINDISKDNPNIVISLVQKWIGQTVLKDKMLKHGARTLLKQSDTRILSLFGYKKIDDIQIIDFEVSSNVRMGEELEFSFSLTSQQGSGKVRVEYILEFVRLREKTSKKVFMIAEGNCQSKIKQFAKKYSFKPITTRKYYSGTHNIYIIVNGEELASKSFELID